MTDQQFAAIATRLYLDFRHIKKCLNGEHLTDKISDALEICDDNMTALAVAMDSYVPAEILINEEK
ncbi:MAG: hypothetical protein LBM87_08455 [Ruminococcus sp.]|jgi:hypothetical protein|nr:hypothetical protein [Ruminococcus sp.]